MSERAPAPDRFFDLENGAYVPQPICRSPWRKSDQNGIAIGTLLAHTMLEAMPQEGMNIARFTLDILRPVPMAPTQAEWRSLRAGRRTQVLEGALIVDGVKVVQASALFVRHADEGAPATVFGLPVPLPEDAPNELMMSLKTGLESRVVQRGAAGSVQPEGRVWVRQSLPVAQGTGIHPVVTAVLAADFGGGISSGIDRAAWTSPNIDIAVHFVRPPRDEWILVEAQTLMLGNSSALVEAKMSDRFGLFGHSHQTLFITPSRSILSETRL